MRGKSMILIVIALGCGLVASIGISQILDSRGGQAVQAETRKIYVAVKEVDISQVLDAESIKLEEWPVEKIPEGAVTSLEEVKGLSPNQRLYAGEPIRKEKLVDPTKRGGEAQRIPAGYRVQAIKVKAEDVAGNLIGPGDHVDVIVYLRKGNSIPETVTKTFMEDVRVFAVNQTTTREQDEEGNKISAKTVSLLVKPAQVQELLLASRLGQISLSLRRPDDEQVVDTTQGSTISDFFTGTAVDGTPQEKAVTAGPSQSTKSAASDFTAWLNEITAENSAQPAPAAQDEQVADAFFHVQMLTPTGVVNWEVANNKTMYGARQVTDEPQAAPAPAAPIAPAAAPNLDVAPLGDGLTSPAADAASADDAQYDDQADSAAGDDSDTDSASGDEEGFDSL
jgi:pilus assembly protein CpaB